MIAGSLVNVPPAYSAAEWSMDLAGWKVTKKLDSKCAVNLLVSCVLDKKHTRVLKCFYATPDKFSLV